MSSEFSLERITQLVSDLEQELLAAPPGSAKLDALREEIMVLKRTLEQPDGSSGELSDHLHGVRGRLSEVLASEDRLFPPFPLSAHPARWNPAT